MFIAIRCFNDVGCHFKILKPVCDRTSSFSCNVHFPGITGIQKLILCSILHPCLHPFHLLLVVGQVPFSGFLTQLHWVIFLDVRGRG